MFKSMQLILEKSRRHFNQIIGVGLLLIFSPLAQAAVITAYDCDGVSGPEDLIATSCTLNELINNPGAKIVRLGDDSIYNFILNDFMSGFGGGINGLLDLTVSVSAPLNPVMVNFLGTLESLYGGGISFSYDFLLPTYQKTITGVETLFAPGMYMVATGTSPMLPANDFTVSTSITMNPGTTLNGFRQSFRIPEPTTVALMGLGLVGLSFSARRRKS